MNFIPNSPEQRRAMLERIGVENIAELFRDIPVDVKLARPMDIPAGMSEQELLRHMKELSAKNAAVGDYLSFLGAGAYEHHVPSFVNQLLLRQEFYTAYTPY
ncbi:MAG TPA: glycine dehydrogenase, partial [Verrucomicrobiae bacterium]|nr:glycine dehydrogenase [Verrucomicrobiae bacterium]